MGPRTWLGLKKGREYRANAWRAIELDVLQPSFPIDIVYTWVDGDDPEFQGQLSQFRPPGALGDRHPASDARFRNHDELRYSLRSVATYAHWVNHIYIVTNGQRPAWLAPHPKISIVRHDEILDRKYLPTFNSHVIESALHNIPNLSEHYVYFNDDVLLLRPVEPGNMFTENGLAYAVRTNFVVPDKVASEDHHGHATINARALIEKEWNVNPLFRLGHSFHPQIRSVAIECEQKFAQEYDAFRRNRFRARNDILCCSFLHPYAAYLMGKALFTHAKYRYVKVRSPKALLVYRRLMAQKGRRSAPECLCVNDSATRGIDIQFDYAAHLRYFFDRYYPDPSPFEVDEGNVVRKTFADDRRYGAADPGSSVMVG